VIFGRLSRNGHLQLVASDTTFRPGDLVSVIGEADALDRTAAVLGSEAPDHLEFSREELDFRRIFVSSPAVSGKRLRDLDLPRRHHALVTRIRRGDIEILPTAETVLEPGDRVRVVTSRERMQDVTRYFGDSYRAISEVDILTFSLGIALGLALGRVPIPLPGGIEFELGIAGGPLLVALVLGSLQRTGRLQWTIPYSANLTLRQFGLMLFLAGIGTRAGFAFRETIASGHGALL
jgi:putative transport protein